jgi:hypothetical protein
VLKASLSMATPLSPSPAVGEDQIVSPRPRLSVICVYTAYCNGGRSAGRPTREHHLSRQHSPARSAQPPQGVAGSQSFS